MSVVGFDFGNMQSVIAVARNRGIDIICNEVSNRFTPSLVSFGPKSRHLGEGAATLQVSNLKNTVGSLKRLVGRPADDPTLAQEAPFVSAPLVPSPQSSSNEVGVRVNYLGEDEVFSATQLAAMYLGKLKAITEHETKSPVSDVVISVPVWFAPAQRQAMIEAAQIAGLNPLRIINDTTATALAYGITKTDLPEDTPRKVVFVDIGHSSTSIAAVSFVKGKLQVKATASDAFLGGRDLDQLLVDHFVNEFKQKYGFDLAQHPKPLFRLRAAIERLKKVLSSNSQAPLNIEALFEDRDVSSMISREEFEQYAAPFVSRIQPMLRKVLDEAGWDKDEVFCVESVGGSTRVPAVREAISSFFARDVLSYTVNQDEAVARGCALMCAIISPAFRVRDFDIKDVSTYNATVSWLQHGAADGAADEAKSLTVFEKGSVVPATKVLTFYRKPEQPFEFEANMDAKATPPVVNVPSFIGRYTITKVPVGSPENPTELTTLKVRVRMNPDHMVHVESAHALVEDNTPEEPVAAPAEGDAAANPGSSSPVPASDEPPKKKHKKVEVPVVSSVPHMVATLLGDLKVKEQSMQSVDKLVFDTEVAKNNLEEYIYEARDKKDAQWSDYISEADKSTLCDLLNAHEDWLYSDEGEDASKAVYEAKLAELKAIGQPAQEKYRESEERPAAQQAFFDTVNKFLARCDHPEFAWLPEAELKALKDKLTAKKEWANNLIKQQMAQPKHAPLLVTAAQLVREKDEAERSSVVLFNRPKPAPKVEEPAPAAAADGETPAAEGENKAEDSMNVD
ncbi:heat shock protein 70 family [Catenaria anguillulae PL171]|uniref:Heat shock protein 70 family n=1 Tax=Catenaria anguillulae PL171 TaxID=765915 RepID=A0A1Y2HE02_9FUNG|nr:heat shock protein 70 family [Catenaria anguillulae PL171]